MIKITKNIIHMTRGDTLSFTLTIVDQDGETYEPGLEDKVYFRVKKNAWSKYSLVKEIPTNTMELKLNSEDTYNLIPGDYKYEIELVTPTFNYTIFENEKFVIGEELEDHEA